MVELVVVNINGLEYLLKNSQTEEEYNFRIKFYKQEKPVVVGDKIMVHPELLDRNYVEYSRKLQFGDINAPYGRKIDSYEHKDLICVKKGDEDIWLKRFFG